MRVYFKKTILSSVMILLIIVGCSNGGTEVENTPNPNNEQSENNHDIPNNEEKNEQSEQNLTKEQREKILVNKSNEIVKAFANQEMEILANYIHEQKGLLVAPDVYIQEDAIVIEQKDIAQILSDSKTYKWGYHDGSGEPMQSTPREYFQRFTEFEDPDEILIDDIQQRSNTINNIKEVFPESHVIEFYRSGTEEFGNMDWSSLYFVYELDEKGIWKLVALVSGQWTI